MSSVARLGRILSRLGAAHRIDLAMDLGTANTLLYVKGRGIVVNEPSVVAVDTRSGRTIALGKEAAEYLGRTPEWISAVRPLKDGVIADFDAAMAMIKGFLAMVMVPRFWISPRLVIGVPSGITQVEKRAVKDSAYEAGARDIYLVEEPMAAAMGAGLDVEKPGGNMVVDIGGGTTEVAVISLCATTYCESIRVAGDEMDEAIVRFLHRTMHMEIMPAFAERVKIAIGSAIPVPGSKERSLEVTGKEIGRGGPRSVTMTQSMISEALQEPVDAIVDTVRKALENTSATLLSDVKQRGIMLTGGGALLPGLDVLVEQMTGIHTRVARDPLTSVVEGCGTAIEDLKRWERIFIA